MSDIIYAGEHLLPGQAGHLLILTAFVFSILSVLSYRKAALLPDDVQWRNFARLSWTLQGAAVLGAIATLFYLMIAQMYEYRYAWDHVSNDLPLKYIFSAFWEGQEGSFLLWMFWHVLLGFAVILTARKWEAGVMTWLSVVQAILVSMVCGLYFTDDIRLGSSPFLLLRETMDAPIFNNPDYLGLIEGNGLNPLLQNYWMTIHPPTLFLGFASVTIPFCFAMTGLWQRDHLGWMKPAMPWTLFSGGILGLGILMGGAWAYEALSFGGYWAWDPVENMSLVPWLVLIAGLHGNFIARHTGQSIRVTYFFYLLAFLLVLYSTFLTRSGILGDESVHAFTEMGLEWQLVGFIAVFAVAAGYLLVTRRKDIPAVRQEETLYSREFWMFIGALILMFSAILISFTTSIPVWNKLVDAYGSLRGIPDMTAYHKAMPLDPVDHHNRFQLWIAVLVAILSAISLPLRFKGAGWAEYRKRFLLHVGLSLLLGSGLAALLSLWIQITGWPFAVLLFASSYGIVANLDYIVRFTAGRWRSLAAPLAHGGLALMLVGILASGLNKRILSENRFAQEGLAMGMNSGENTFLIKGMPMFMNGYWVTYESDTLKGLTREYQVRFAKVNEAGDTTETFTTHPNVLYERKMNKVAAANPYTKRYADRDIFTYVAALPPELQDVANVRKVDSSLHYVALDLSPGDSVRQDKYWLRLDSLTLGTRHPAYQGDEGDLTLSANLSIWPATDSSSDGARRQAIFPTVILRQGLVYGMTDQVNDFNLRARIRGDGIDRLLPDDNVLKYDPLTFRAGQTIHWQDLELTLEGVDNRVSHPNYVPQAADIAIHGVFRVQAQDARTYTARPLFYIRDGQPLNLKDYIPDLGLHLRLDRIDPQKEEFEVLVARPSAEVRVPLEVALDSPRNDFIVLQAILFPGINLFWAGSLLMLLGLFLGMFKRLVKAKPQSA